MSIFLIALSLVTFFLSGCHTLLARIRHEDRAHIEMAMKRDLEEYKVTRPGFFEPLEVPLQTTPILHSTDDSTVVLVETESSIVRCSATERAIWIMNPQFTLDYLACSTKKMGQPGPVGTCLHEIYPTVSVRCGECLGEASYCAAKKCFRVCIRNQGSPVCRKCFDDKCGQALMGCTGATDSTQLPMPPVNKDMQESKTTTETIESADALESV
jgi:hypothetical protein